MQSFIASLRCVDCKDNQFISAASLLSHFAQHIIDYDSSEVHGGEPRWASPAYRKRSSESILEQVLKRSVSRHHDGHQDGHHDGHQSKAVTVLVPVRSPSHTEPSSYSADSSGEGSGEGSLTPPPPGEKDCGSRCSSASSYSSSGSASKQVALAKFDMQQRLESCVLNLVSKREQADPWDANSHNEELNPLTLCTVTIEEDDADTGLSLEPAKKINNRKQQKPKKISRQMNGMLNELSAKLPENTTITVKSPEPEKASSPPKKKYPCHICSKVFGWSTDLKRHILIHTGERPFKCRHCTSSFTRNFLLQKHEKKVHGRGVSMADDSAMLIAMESKFVVAEPEPEPEPELEPEPQGAPDTDKDAEGDAEGNLVICEDDKSSADENDNHMKKRRTMDSVLSGRCSDDEHWRSEVLQQEAMNS